MAERRASSALMTSQVGCRGAALRCASLLSGRQHFPHSCRPCHGCHALARRECILAVAPAAAPSAPVRRRGAVKLLWATTPSTGQNAQSQRRCRLHAHTHLVCTRVAHPHARPHTYPASYRPRDDGSPTAWPLNRVSSIFPAAPRAARYTGHLNYTFLVPATLCRAVLSRQTENDTPIKDPECASPYNLVMMEEMTQDKLLGAIEVRTAGA